MIVDIHLQNFRSYIDDSFEFSDKVNIIVGPNASGKTNLLEALITVTSGSSYKAQDKELINFKSDWTRLESRTENQERIVKISLDNEKRATKTYEINNQPYKRLVLGKTIPIVLFEPNHLLLLNGPPELRRNFIDAVLEQTKAGFKTLKLKYKRALRQRNSLLKRGIITNNQLFPWNLRLSELGGQLVAERLNVTSVFSDQISDNYKAISKTKDKISLRYHSGCNLANYESDLLDKLEGSIQTDYERGFTSFGPHRDDLEISINNHPGSETASRGEVRTIILSLKTTEAQIIESAREQKPILLFDDVFSELDGARRLSLVEFLSNNQSFVTTTDADIVVQHFMGSNFIIPLNA
ncbi:MAG TPA: DNA replication and repair protein RecF [Candidatus Saccharimonadales bacterium]|nr:DNA replication and repair protein RecF [Candidatus Saccharimonadales bacterium]